MRSLFTDGTNSLAHFGLGVLATRTLTTVIVVGFLLYQVTEDDPANNILVDIAEFAIGYAVGTFVI